VTTSSGHSPYEVVLGDALAVLHPRLSAYFSVIPAGSSGHGEGVFDIVGTPRRWLWPILWVLGRQGVLFPVYERAVAFTVTNTPLSRSGSAGEPGSPAIDAVRTFAFGGGARAMVDRIGVAGSGANVSLVDDLGVAARYRARLAAIVVNGELHLSSTTTSVRLGRRRLALPAFVAPVVSLVERFDDERDQQHVTVILSSPLVGKLYEYSGYFTYELAATHGSATEGTTT